MRLDSKAERTRRFTPKVKTGCFNCRRRRIKCPEQLPSCKRCEIANLDCQYPFNRSKHVLANLAPQPSTALLQVPDGVTPSNGDLELFNTFCQSTVRISSGPFNQRFWQVDVPRAAARHPALWHAGIALAAINLSVSISATKNINSNAVARYGVPRNRQYVQALSHYNSSIQHLRRSLTATDNQRTLSYLDKEMAVMTNVLYVGIAGILEDDEQRSSHCHNLLRLLESVRFGEDDPGSRRGVMAYDGLLSLVLSLEGSTPGITPRSERAWSVKVPPAYGPFTSVTEAYIAFLPLIHHELRDREASWGCSSDLVRFPRFIKVLEQFQESLSNLRSTVQCWSREDDECVAVMGQHLKLTMIGAEALMAPSREEFLKHDAKYTHELDRIESLLTEEAFQVEPGCRAPRYVPGQPYLYSLSYGSLLEHTVAYSHNEATRRRGIAMMRKWPYKENGMCGHENARSYENFIAHELSGPERTRAHQLAGNPVIPKYENGCVKGRKFDGTRECECLYGRYICREHKIISRVFDPDVDPHSLLLTSKYELRNDIPGIRYSI